jgi:2-dehydro-3-deoxyphosphooctonate aldolase (KDO 8-P synthase)
MILLQKEIGNNRPFFLMAGPCVIESEEVTFQTALELKKIAEELKLFFIFKASFDKANRTSATSFRGPGLKEGLKILEKIKTQLQIPIMTDVHEDTPINEISSIVDIIQTPAFLARQTSFIKRVALSGKPVNIKKAQFMAPEDMFFVAEKYKHFGNDSLMLCDRGTSFGYNTLISDMRGLAIMRKTGYPVVFDATHSVQEPGGEGSCSGGNRQMVPVLARAAIASGIAGLFMEIHPDPDKALCDGPNSWPLYKTRDLLKVLKEIDTTVKSQPYIEEQF